MNRPRGVTLIAALLLATSIFLFVITATAYTHPEILVQYHILRLKSPETSVEAASGIVIIAPLSGCMLAVIGVGLLTLRSWARWAVLLTTGLGLCRILAAVVLTFLLRHDQFILTPLQTIPILLNASIVFYLTRPAVKAAFGEGTDARIYSE